MKLTIISTVVALIVTMMMAAISYAKMKPIDIILRLNSDPTPCGGSALGEINFSKIKGLYYLKIMRTPDGELAPYKCVIANVVNEPHESVVTAHVQYQLTDGDDRIYHQQFILHLDNGNRITMGPFKAISEGYPDELTLLFSNSPSLLVIIGCSMDSGAIPTSFMQWTNRPGKQTYGGKVPSYAPIYQLKTKFPELDNLVTVGHKNCQYDI